MRIFLMGATPSFSLSKHTTVQERLAATGGNAGNQIIAFGLLKTLEYSTVEWDHSIGPERVDKEFDIIVIAAANFLFPGFDFGGMAKFIESTRLPVAMVGLGAQSNDRNNTKISLQAGTLRLLQIASERSTLIGVRGEYTAQVLADLKINNVQVTGCPSYYATGVTGYNLRHEVLSVDTPIAVHASRDVLRHSFDAKKMKAVILKLYAEAARRNGVFVAQTEADEITLADSSNSLERVTALNRLKAEMRGAVDDLIMERWLQSNMRVFWTVPDWIEAMRVFPFVIGTRFHGTMAALHAGTPAVCICHDTRTAEMCEYLSIPHVTLASAEKLPIGEIFDTQDFNALNKRYAALRPLYDSFLKENRLLAKHA